MDSDDIQITKRELAEELEILNRAEEIIRRRRAEKAHSSSAAHEPKQVRKRFANSGLQNLLFQIVSEAERGIRANEAMKLARERGYQFSNPKNASASVGSALTRLVKSKKVSKRDKKYRKRVEQEVGVKAEP